ncbi:MAG: DNA replication/repair protein RecF [Prevotellaceae bacterium]|nr:DNA replication/repair protein RecF [Prevotellaceae bacterium]
MYLRQLNITNFKNLEQVNLSLSPGLNCFIGDNGEGKTNLLDAVYYLSMAKSYFHQPDSQVIRHGEGFFMLQGFYERNGAEEQLSCGVKKGEGKALKRNGKQYERLADHIGFIPLVMVSPTDSVLITDSGEERRRYLNSLISQIDREYLDSLIRYNHALMLRNKLLKQSGSIDRDMLDTLDTQLSEYGQKIHEKRKHILESMAPYFTMVYAVVSGNKEDVQLPYRSDLSKESLYALLKQSFEKDKLLQHTSVGIHRDDVEMQMGEHPIRRVGSQGQQKTYLLALKLAQFELYKKHSGIAPLLLLDDVFDKLDMARVEHLIQLVAHNGFGQIFLTDSNKTRLDAILASVGSEHALFRVKNGEVETLNVLHTADDETE